MEQEESYSIVCYIKRQLTFVRVKEVYNQMKEAILYTNRELIKYCHPKTGNNVQIMDLGGQTTLGMTT